MGGSNHEPQHTTNPSSESPIQGNPFYWETSRIDTHTHILNLTPHTPNPTYRDLAGVGFENLGLWLGAWDLGVGFGFAVRGCSGVEPGRGLGFKV